MQVLAQIKSFFMNMVASIISFLQKINFIITISRRLVFNVVTDPCAWRTYVRMFGYSLDDLVDTCIWCETPYFIGCPCRWRCGCGCDDYDDAWNEYERTYSQAELDLYHEQALAEDERRTEQAESDAEEMYASLEQAAVQHQEDHVYDARWMRKWAEPNGKRQRANNWAKKEQYRAARTVKRAQRYSY